MVETRSIDDWWLRSEWWMMMNDDWLTIETDEIKERNNQEGRKQHLKKWRRMKIDWDWDCVMDFIHVEWILETSKNCCFGTLVDVWLVFVRYVWHVDLVVVWLLLIRLIWWLVCRWALYQLRVRFVVGLCVGPVVVRNRVMIRLFCFGPGFHSFARCYRTGQTSTIRRGGWKNSVDFVWLFVLLSWLDFGQARG